MRLNSEIGIYLTNINMKKTTEPPIQNLSNTLNHSNLESAQT